MFSEPVPSRIVTMMTIIIINEKEDDTSTFEASSGTDINTSDDDMEIDITW